MTAGLYVPLQGAGLPAGGGSNGRLDEPGRQNRRTLTRGLSDGLGSAHRSRPLTCVFPAVSLQFRTWQVINSFPALLDPKDAVFTAISLPLNCHFRIWDILRAIPDHLIFDPSVGGSIPLGPTS